MKKLGTETIAEERLLAEHQSAWSAALTLDGSEDLQASLLRELGEYVQCEDLDLLRRRCRGARGRLEREWRKKVKPEDRRSVEQFYDQSDVHLYELTWRHSLAEDTAPLAYVAALRFAEQQGCRTYLDLGAGVGAGAILFARRDLKVALADISTKLLDFCEWRFGYKRELPAQVIDLKFTALPSQAFDLVTALDVFEHLVDPVAAVEQVYDALKPGAFLIGRFCADRDGHRFEHIAQDLGPLRSRMDGLGFLEVGQDEGLWGCQAFQKR